MKSRIHRMPFGAEVQDDGAIRFRLWAPTAKSVELSLSQNDPATPSRINSVALRMNAQADGWYELITTEATIGSLYQFRIDGGLSVPDPASRSNPSDVHGPSCVVEPGAFAWQDAQWTGRPWYQAVIYELHVGTFTAEGTFAGVERHLAHLSSLGVTAIELMPIAEFPGQRNWGYDGVLPFAPDAAYGTPNDLKRLVDAAHARGIMVMLDVVYNHFGPDGNYLHAYAKHFFTDRHKTPWGEAIDFESAHSRPVREFFIHNALYWLEEYHLDGLRFDAVHAVIDNSPLDIFAEISRRIRDSLGRERQIHLVLENVNNQAHRLSKPPAAPGRFEAQWNDDIHHCLHVLLTGEHDGYYQDFHAGDHSSETQRLLGRCLAEGFAYQGEYSRYRHNKPRGEASSGLPPTAFVSFLQNHDQIGNRALGDRLAATTDPRALRAAVAILLLSPQPPMLFMGEEWGAAEPFPFFCDFGPELAEAVRKGRLEEFSRFDRFNTASARTQIPDPNAVATARQATLDWSRLTRPEHADWLDYYRQLLSIRHTEIIPRLHHAHSGRYEITDHLLKVTWPLNDRSTLTLIANLSPASHVLHSRPGGQILFATDGAASTDLLDPNITPWSVLWTLSPGHG